MARQGTVKVAGLRELQRSYALMGKEAKKGMRDDLKEIGEPVRLAAEQLAEAAIKPGQRTPAWSTMRTGVTTRVGYVAPKARRLKTTPATMARPKFATLLLFRALLPALERSEQRVIAGFEKWLDKLADKGGF